MMLAEDMLDGTIDRYAGHETDVDEWDLPALKQAILEIYGLEPRDVEALDFSDKSSDEIRDLLWERIQDRYVKKEALVEPSLLRRVERDIMLQIVDAQWKDHLYSLDHLKEGIGLRGYGQRDPLVEYKKESFQLFQAMKDRIDEETVRYLWRLMPVLEPVEGARRPAADLLGRPAPRRQGPMTLSGAAEPVPAFAGAARAASGGGPRPARTGGDDAAVRTVRREEPKVGRNDPCPCGSGKKYKKCHGA
jgi:preprotein translocase subunit SecA